MKLNRNLRKFVFALIVCAVLMLTASLPAAAQARNYKSGDKIEVLWSGTWYKAEIIQAKDGQYKIHYDGYGDNWDEWVKTDRMRVSNQIAAPTDKAKNSGNDKAAPDFAAKRAAAQTAAQKSKQAIPPLEYAYVSAFTKTDDGKFITGNASGSLLLLADGKYKHTRYIGTILNLWKPGTYKIAGDRITLTPDDKTEDAETWTFVYSQENLALSLMTDDKSLGYLLVMSGTEAMTRCAGGLTFDLRCQ